LSFEDHHMLQTQHSLLRPQKKSKVQFMVSVSDGEKFVHAFVTSRLDYCNALAGSLVSSLNIYLYN